MNLTVMTVLDLGLMELLSVNSAKKMFSQLRMKVGENMF